MTKGQVIKFVCVSLLCPLSPSVGIKTVAVAAKYNIYIHYVYISQNLEIVASIERVLNM